MSSDGGKTHYLPPYGVSMSIERLFADDCSNFLPKYYNTLQFCGISRCQFRNTINTTGKNQTKKIVRNDDERRQKLDFYIIPMNLDKFLATLMRYQLA